MSQNLKTITKQNLRTHTQKNLRIDVTISWSAPAYIRGRRQWLRVHNSTLTHLSVLYKEQAEGILAAEVEHINVILHSYLQDRQREREKNTLQLWFQTLWLWTRISNPVKSRQNSVHNFKENKWASLSPVFSKNGTHTHHRIVGRYSPLIISFLDILLLSLSSFFCLRPSVALQRLGSAPVCGVHVCTPVCELQTCMNASKATSLRG